MLILIVMCVIKLAKWYIQSGHNVIKRNNSTGRCTHNNVMQLSAVQLCAVLTDHTASTHPRDTASIHLMYCIQQVG